MELSQSDNEIYAAANGEQYVTSEACRLSGYEAFFSRLPIFNVLDFRPFVAGSDEATLE